MSSGTRISSGTKTDSDTVYAGRGIFHGIKIVSGGAAGGTITVYDNTAASGNELFECTVTSAGRPADEGFIAERIRCLSGIHVACSAADLEYIVYYGA